MTVEERIENRSTELQEVYDVAILQTEKSNAKIIKLVKELDQEREHNRNLSNLIDRCKKRAIEQGYPNIF